MRANTKGSVISFTPQMFIDAFCWAYQ